MLKMQNSNSFFSLIVAIASAHVKQRPLSFSDNSTYDANTNLYTGHDITSNKAAVNEFVKTGLAVLKIDEFGHAGLELVARPVFLSDFAEGVKSGRIGIGVEGCSNCAFPVAFLAGYMHYTDHQKFKSMPYRLDHGRVCHGMICEDTEEVWTQ
ncbi:hypothetical protein ABLA30_07045 [Xenorhabdus nematophila]|uniref:hypothetical protein n=1 Tax=Xenorhabdus nematophila TaxID=628 RepID=UPI0032B77FD5